ncbi:MAG: PAS domain-containing protein [Comamonadaceae bacterium]|nr:MAG: PAS domain-containing protein [Comamonadaceae bacterium]
MATISAALGEHKQAYEFSAQALDLSGKIAREKVNIRVGELAKIYQNDSRQRKIDELNLLEKQRELEQRWLGAVLGGSIFVLGISVFFLLRLRRSHHLLETTNTQLRESQNEICALNVELEQRVQSRTDELRQQTRYLRTLIDALPVWLWLKDTEGRYLTVNVSTAALHGYVPQQMIGQTDESLQLDQSGESFRASDIEVMQMRQRKTWEQAIANEEGEISWHEIDKVPVIDIDGTLLGTVGIGRDITERKRMEDELAQRERDFRSLVENIPIALIRYDSEHRRRYLNPVAEKLLHCNSAEMLGQRPGGGRVTATPAMLETYERMMDEVLLTGQTRNLDVVSDALPANQQRHYEVRFVPEQGTDGKTIGVLAIWRDITERKKYELSLLARAELEERQSQFFNVAPGFFYTTVRHPDGKYEIPFASSGIRELLGLEPDAVMQNSSVLFGVAHPDDFDMAARKSEESERDLSPYHIEYRIMHPDKGLRWMEVRLLTQRLASGGTRWDGFMHDITGRKHLETSLATREQEFRSLAESSPDFIVRYDREGRHLYFNNHLLHQLGLASADEALGKRPSEVWPDGRFDELELVVVRAIESGIQGDIEIVEQAERSGFRYHQLFVVPERDAAGQIVGAIAFGREITAIREAERKLAHFINNLPGMAYTFCMSADGRGSFPYVSPAIEELYGLRSEDVKSDMTPIHALAHPDDQLSIEAAIAESLRTMRRFQIEFRICRPDKPERWIDVRSVPERQTDGSLLWYGLMFDITERKRMEVALKDSEARYRHNYILLQSMLESSPSVSVYSLDREYRLMAFNRKFREAAKRLWGADIAMGMSIFDVIDTQAHRDFFRQGADQVLAGRSYSLDSQEAVVKDGVTLYEYHENYGSPIRTDDGEIIGLTVFAITVTERKEAEHRLKEALAFSEGVINAIPDLLFEVDRDGRYLNLWTHTPELLTAQKEVLLGSTVHAALPPESAEMVMACLREAEEKGVSFGKVIHIDLPQGISWFELSVSRKPGDGTFLVLSRDITERKHIEQALTLREQEFRSLAENLPVAVIRYDAEYRRRYLNRAAERMLHGNSAELLGQLPGGSNVPVTPAMIEHYLREMKAVLVTGAARDLVLVFDALPVDSQEYYEVRFVPEHGANGQATGILAIWYDITERKRMEDQLAAREQEFRALAENSPDTIARYAPGGIRTYINPVFSRLTGKPVHDMLGKTAADYQATPGAGTYQRALLQSLKSGEEGECEYTWPTHDGSLITSHIRIVPEFGAGGKVVSVLAVGRDITERKRLENELKQREREFRVLAENLPDPVFRYDRNCRRIYVNPAAMRVTRMSSEQLIGHMPPDAAALESASAARAMQTIREVLATGERRSLFVEYIGEDGSISEYQGLLVPEFDADGLVASVLAIAHEVTNLRAAERRAASFFSNMPGFAYTFVTSPEGRMHFPFASRGIEVIFGLKPEDVRDDAAPMRALVQSDDWHRVEVAIMEASQTLQPFDVEARIQQPGHPMRCGHPMRWIGCHSMPERQTDGTILWHGIMLDITERKRMESRLREQKDFQDTLLNGLNEVGLQMMLIENDRIVYVSNRKLASELGYTEEDIEAHPFVMDLIHPDDRERIAGYQRSRMAGQVWPSYYELSLVSRDGKRREYETSIALLPGGDPMRIITIGKDITERKRMQEMLRDSHRFLYNIIDTIADPIFVKDRQHLWLHVNDAFCRFIGYSREELVGKSDFDYFPAHEAHVFWAGDDVVFASGQEFSNEERFTNSAGETRYILTRKTLFTDASQQQPLLVGIISDFTERKRMEDELHLREQKFRTLAENAPDNIVRYDLAGRIVYVNPVLKRTLGVQGDSILGTRARDNPSGGHFDAYVDTLDQVLASGEDGEIEMTLPDTPDGAKVHHIRLVAERNDAGDMIGVLAIGRDITELKRYEAARDAALAEAVRLAKTRSEFLAHMSHELRTPLNGILGYTQILQRDKDLDERHADALKVEAGRLTLDVDEISLAVFLRGVADIVNVRAMEKGIEFSCVFAHDLPTDIRADEKRLRQVLLNLLANAVKFTRQGRVVLHVSRVDALRLAFMVEDTGVGIAAHELESIFQPFEQSGEALRRFGGSGLGLSISRQLMRLMGGDIWVESRLGEGSRFGFELALTAGQSESEFLFEVCVADIHREPSGQTVLTEASDQPMLVPNVEKLKALQHLAQLGNMRDILQYVENLAEIDPAYLPFIVQLRQMAQAYQSKALLAFINEYLHDADTL